MMTIERVLQICIVLACVVVLFSRFSSIGTVDAQGCGGSPPVDPDYLTEAWLQGSSVSVKIHEKNNGQETSQPEFDAIDSAIKSWNSIKVSGCSNVTFGNATRTNTVWGGFTAPPPSANEVFVVRTEDRDGQFLEIGTPTGLAGGWLFMRSSFNHILIPPGKGPLYRVDNLAKHEAGHSFGVDDGLPGHPSSAMGPLSFDASNTLQIMRSTGHQVKKQD